jgi:hypothetical protein
MNRLALIASALCIGASAVHAGDPPRTPAAAPLDDSARAEAGKLVREGVRLLEADDLPGALARFRAAYARYPSPKILVNIGTTLTRMGRTVEAANTYQRYLEATGAEASRISEVKDVLASLDPALGKLTIFCDPGDAEVRVNDDEWLQPASAHTVRVPPGTYVVRARRGTQVAEETGAVGRGETQQIALTLREAPPAPTREPKPTALPTAARVATAAEPPAGPDDHPPGTDLGVDAGARPGRGRRIFALTAGGAGVAAIVAGGYLGLQARSTWADARAMCPEGCSGSTFDAADALADRARSRAGLATALVGGGVVAAAAGAVLWLTAPSAPPRLRLDAAAGPTQVGLTVTGRF